MLTARGQAVDRIVGLEVGADDYLPKPFDERELVARMRAILRRSGPRGGQPEIGHQREQIVVGDITVDLGARLVRCGETTIDLTAVEFDLLVLLLRSAGQVVSRERITREVLDRKLMAMDRSVDTHISRVRRKLGPHPNGEERIKTVRGYGYIYALPALEIAS
jgi:two-component system response regulator CpxR